MTKREFLDTVFALVPNEANKIMDAFDEYVESNVVQTGRSGKERRMSKYIIELDDRIKLVTSVGVTENGVVYTTSDYVHNLEELNSDHINEHFGELQGEAYQAGLNDAWETARALIWDTSISEYETAGVKVDDWEGETCEVLRRYPAYEAVELLRTINSIGQPKLDFQSDIDRFVENANKAITELAKKFVENMKDMYK